ncbi:MAG: GNAT family N-acetyltransferase [Pseudomonadota bacterium]
MAKNGSEPVSPIIIRAATGNDASAIAAVHVASWRETYAGLMPQTMLKGLSVSDRTARWVRILDRSERPEGPGVFVAEHGGDLVGFASSGSQRDPNLLAQGFTGEITAIYVLQDMQGRGGGRRLMAAIVEDLQSVGYDAASLWVLRENLRARRFYERLGGAIIGEKQDHRDAVTFTEIAYGWRDLSKLRV